MSVNEVAGATFVAIGVVQIAFAGTTARWSMAAARWFYERMLPRYTNMEHATKSARWGGAMFILFGVFVWWQG
jgi:hypothetical protein